MYLVLEEENRLSEKTKDVFIVLTDTNTLFSKMSKVITLDSYNHVSMSFDSRLRTIYTYALKGDNGKITGGLKRENSKILKGSKYLLYKITVSIESYKRLQRYIKNHLKNLMQTSYNHLGLINAIFDKDIFKNENKTKMICSEFVIDLFESAGIKLVNRQTTKAIRPYELANSKVLQFVKEDIFK